MFSWKVMAATIVALFAISAFLVGSLGDNDILFSISNWFQESPLSGIFSEPEKGSKEVSFFLYSENFSIDLTDHNISLGDIDFSLFTGTLFIDFENNTLSLQEKGSDLNIKSPLKQTTLENIRISSWVLNNMKFNVTSVNMDTDSGIIEIYGFLGTLMVNEDNIFLNGNISKLKVVIDNSTWELM